MNTLTFAIAMVCTQQSAPPVTDLSAYNSDKTFRATLHLPKKIRWGSQPTEHRGGQANPVSISLTNVSGESRYAFETFWSDSSIYYENVGRGPLGGPVSPLMIISSPSFNSDTQFMHKLDHGQGLSGSIFPEMGWFFDVTQNGTYKVNIVYDDTSLWPPNIVNQCVGRIVFPLTMRVSNDSLSFVPRQPKRGEVGRPPVLFVYQCWPEKLPNYMRYRKTDSRR
ncbi:MAG: hypothetical protein M3R13_07665 [Armatimonadota bacterium]|nr:hypothetical protein [Armatimonadota bacterium]